MEWVKFFSEANCQESSCPGLNVAEHLHKAELSRFYYILKTY